MVARTTRVELGATGFRVGDRFWRGRHRPWSGVREIRPVGGGTRWSEIRGARAADAPVRIAGMTREQAEELQGRLNGARARARQTSSPPS